MEFWTFFPIILLFVLFFLKKICPMYRESTNKIKKGMWSLIFANIIFLLAIVSLSVYPIKLTSITAPQFLPFVLLSTVVLAVYPVFFRSIGVSSITSAVNKYGGNCRFTAKNGEFSCVVIIEI